MKKLIAAVAVAVAGTASQAFADVKTKNSDPLDGWVLSADEMVDTLNSLPIDEAMQFYKVQSDIIECLTAGNALDSGALAMNQSMAFNKANRWTMENHIQGRSSNTQIDYSDMVVCASQAEAQIAVCNGADAVYDPDSGKIISFSGHLSDPKSSKDNNRLECTMS